MSLNRNKMKTEFKTTKGFTLIEVVMYLGLFTLIIGSVLTSVDSILEANARSHTKVMVQEEGAFILGKIDWALTGVTSAQVILGNSLATNKSNYPSNPIEISIEADGNVFIKKGAGAAMRLNNSNVTVACPPSPTPCFEKNLATGDGINPESITANIVVNSFTSDGLSYSQTFSTVKFIRK